MHIGNNEPPNKFESIFIIMFLIVSMAIVFNFCGKREKPSEKPIINHRIISVGL